MQTLDEIMKADVAEKPGGTAAQRRLLERRYDLAVKVDPSARMSRGKPLPVGPTARLSGITWEQLAAMRPEEILGRGLFPYPSLPHPKHATGGQVFPQLQIAMFPRLERFDVEFDLPEALLPEFPPAIFLETRPELGDVSRGEVVSINNFHRLFKDLLTPVQLDGLRMLVTPFPQEEFNPTDDRKVRESQPRSRLLRLSRERPYDGPIPLEPGQPPAAPAFSPGYEQSARRLCPADSRLEAKPALGRGLHGIRAAHRVLQRRSYSRGEEGRQHSGPRPREPYGPDAEHPRLSACTESSISTDG